MCFSGIILQMPEVPNSLSNFLHFLHEVHIFHYIGKVCVTLAKSVAQIDMWLCCAYASQICCCIDYLLVICKMVI